ncbi:MAG: phage minor head protein [Thauera sp.]|jgi:SPP1 gp7 family putative phage head morphogenesis protein|nr:phage minor head protein [Thauera sp.]
MARDGTPAQQFVALFRLEAAEAVRYLQQRNQLTPTFDWRDLWQDEHARQFTVSRLARMDLLKAIQEGITASVQGDLSRRDWTRDTKALLKREGWWGETQVLDPATGEAVATKIDSARLKLIFDMNTRMAYSAGRWERIERNKRSHPYVRYITKGDERVRASHRPWHNLVLPVDAPFWRTHWPPNGWRCRCSAVSLTAREYERRKAAGTIATEAPPVQTREWLNKRTGEVMQVPVGIDPGFDYNVGVAAARAAEMARMAADKLASAPAALGAAAWQEAREQWLPQLAEGYRTWLAQLDSDPQAKSRTPIVGAISPEVLAWLAFEARRTPVSAEIAVTSSPIAGPKAKRHEKKGDALPQQAWEQLPELMSEPIAVLYDTAHGTLLYVLPEASARRGQIAIEFDFERRGKAARNTIISGYRPLLKDLSDRMRRGDLRLVSGTLEGES